MLEALIVSNIILWVVVVLLALLVLALSRQIGILHERVAPAGALQPTTGPKVGELTESLALTALNGESLRIGGQQDTDLITLILFISPTCPVCKSLVPTAQSLLNSERGRMQLLFASDGDNIEQHRASVKDLQIESYPYLISEQLGMTFQVSKLPFAVLIGGDGILKSKGLVNTREHLESLVEAMDSGVATVQEYVGKMTSEYEASAMEQSS